ncbi:hypothetical protein GTU79_20920 [Sodalis ligni]|uniref:hypothetical protein n=1 Tax=Sodalis ligni TaxID=2697027 RepID=UPI001BDE9D9F|nr:hypothetical protein [Sodalis ligni]QWA09755.1 hypothetical protein GTU79_20920 [Sodalis ligni]
MRAGYCFTDTGIGPNKPADGKSGTLLLKGLHTAGRNALTMAAARYTMKDIAARSAQLLLVHSLQPASKIISLNEMIALAKGAARFMDPGFEVIYFVGKNLLSGHVSQ